MKYDKIIELVDEFERFIDAKIYYLKNPIMSRMQEMQTARQVLIETLEKLFPDG